MDEQTVSRPKKLRSAGQKNPSEGKRSRNKKRGGRFINLVLLVGIIGAIGLFAWAEQQRRDATAKLEETQQQLEEIRKSTEQSGQEVADEVIEKVRQIYDLPTDPAPTVATIIDVERLRETSEFYNKANNGDHLVITEDRAILYSAENNRIVDVVPVSREANTPAEGDASPADGAPVEDGTPVDPDLTEDDTNPVPDTGTPADQGSPTDDPVSP